MSASFAAFALLSLLSPAVSAAEGQPPPAGVPRFALEGSGLELSRAVRPGAFYDVVGRRSAFFGYEDRALEAWVYPLKLVDDFKLAFRVEGYPLELPARELATSIQVRPEATILTYSHAAFTVRQILFAPVDEPGLIMLLDVQSVLPLSVIGSFRPRLKLMWPAGLMTGDLAWDEKTQLYSVVEETKRFVAVIGSPGARDLSVMPYQEEPRDVPIRFEVQVSPETMSGRFVPIVMAGSVHGRDEAKATYDRLLASARPLYEANVAHYRELRARTVSVRTPDARLDQALDWAKVGIDKGFANNPDLGLGLLAGFRTSGESERPGFGWFFGRDALWTTLAIDSLGDFAATRAALDFLRRVQREDGKIAHEISQSAALLPWFKDYPYPWNSADATPLYVCAQADHWRFTGDRAYLEDAWESIVKAWRFTAATDSDGNGLVENTKHGHGWVEGGGLHPAHEEIYMQGVWIEACRGLAEMAEALGHADLARQAREAAERTRVATEGTYWLPDAGFYGFATTRPREKPPEAEPGPNRAARQKRMDELEHVRFVDEDTVLPAVPLWWRTLDPQRAQSQIDHLGAATLATDWGTRLLSKHSRLYDPLSYHSGSVWPLFTGWASLAAYRYGRAHVGYQALMANALLTEPGALGYVTELLSGDFNTPFSRSSHHQVWSEAMVVTPLLRGLLGIEVEAAGRGLRIAPQLPADWEQAAAHNLAVGGGRYDIDIRRAGGRAEVTLARRGADRPPDAAGPLRLTAAPAFPLDARVQAAHVNGRRAAFRMVPDGDIQFAEVVVPAAAAHTSVVLTYEGGTDVYLRAETPQPGATSRGLRILRSRAAPRVLRLTLEGLGGGCDVLRVRTPRRLGQAPGTERKRVRPGEWELEVCFDGPAAEYVRRELALSLE